MTNRTQPNAMDIAKALAIVGFLGALAHAMGFNYPVDIAGTTLQIPLGTMGAGMLGALSGYALYLRKYDQDLNFRRLEEIHRLDKWGMVGTRTTGDPRKPLFENPIS